MDESFNVRFEIIGQEDGRWVVKSFDRNNQPLGATIIVNTPSEAWKIFMVLNGYSEMEPDQILQKMEKAS